MTFNYNSWLFTQELRQMDRYLDLLAITVSDNIKQFNISIEEFGNKATTASDKEEFTNFVDSMHEEIEIDYPRILFSSFVVSWYSFMETRLIDFCKRQKLKISVSIQDTENFSKGIDRARKFLRLSANYEINDTHWKKLDRARQVRNKIVHHNGNLPYSYEDTGKKSVTSEMDLQVIGLKRKVYLNLDEEFYHHLKEHGLIDFDRGRFRIMPNINYCKYLVGFGLEFFDNLYKTFNNDNKSD